MSFNDYLKWSSNSLNISYYDSITIRDYDTNNNIERGIITSERIPSNTNLFSIPFTSLLTIDSINNDNIDILKPLLSMNINEDDILSLLLLFEKLKGIESKWSMHINLLPIKYDSLPNYNDDELDIIKGCHLYDIGKKWKLQIKHDYETLMNKKLTDNNNETYYIKDIFIKYFNNDSYMITFEQYLLALSTIWSRFISIETNNNMLLRAMVPLIDLLNHNCNSTTSHIFDKESNNLIIISNDDTPIGEIYLNYGYVSNSRLLQLYGFTLNDNPYNSVNIYINKIIKTKEVSKVLHILDIQYNYDDESCQLTINNNSIQKLLVLLRLQHANNKILQNEMKLLKFIKPNLETEEIVINKLKEVLTELLSFYKTTIEEDEIILKNTNNNNHYNNRILNGINLRYSEKKILMKNLMDLEIFEAQTLLKMNQNYVLEDYSEKLLIGCSSLAGLYMEIGEEKSIQTVESAIDLGFRYFDTAPHYGLGLAEERLSKGLMRKCICNNFNIKIYTKVGRLIFDKKDINSRMRVELENTRDHPSCIFPETNENSIPVKSYTYDSIMKSYNDSIKRLGLSSPLSNDIKLHGLRIHDCDDEESIREVLDGGGLKALIELKTDKKINEVSLGLNDSITALRILKEAKTQNLKIDNLMIAGEFNLLDHSIDTMKLFYYCQYENISIHNAGIYASGVLTGTGSEYYKYKLATTDLLQRVEQWKSLCKEFQFDIKQVALAFAILPNVVTKVAVGIKSNEELSELINNYQMIEKIINSDIFIQAKKKLLLANHISIY